MKLLEQNLYRNFLAHLTALQQLNIVGADTFLRNILNVLALSNFYFLFYYSMKTKTTEFST